MIIINDKNKKFVKKHIPNADEILNSDSARDALVDFQIGLIWILIVGMKMVMTIVTLEGKLKKYMMIYYTIMFMLINQILKNALYRIFYSKGKVTPQIQLNAS